MNTSSTGKPIALIGECMIELQQRADGSLQQSFGGDTLNTAVYLSRALGDKGNEDSYLQQLRRRYPDAPQTRQAVSGL